MGNQNSDTIGRVKWFNNKSGYGFITVTNGEHKESDIFVHHSNIVVGKTQYKYLVQGEYVSLNVESSEKDGCQYQAVNVHGVNGGQLMCETRYDNKISRINNKAKGRTDNVAGTEQ